MKKLELYLKDSEFDRVKKEAEKHGSMTAAVRFILAKYFRVKYLPIKNGRGAKND